MTQPTPWRCRRVAGTSCRRDHCRNSVPLTDSWALTWAHPRLTVGTARIGQPFPPRNEGTLDGTNGVLADGSQEFSDQVLGEWTCRGWFVGDGAHTTIGPWVITTQQYSFGGEVGDATLITEGYEIADVDVPIEHAISGGTSPYVAATGAGAQTLLGFNATEGVDLRFERTVTGAES